MYSSRTARSLLQPAPAQRKFHQTGGYRLLLSWALVISVPSVACVCGVFRPPAFPAPRGESMLLMFLARATAISSLAATTARACGVA